MAWIHQTFLWTEEISGHGVGLPFLLPPAAAQNVAPGEEGTSPRIALEVCSRREGLAKTAPLSVHRNPPWDPTPCFLLQIMLAMNIIMKNGKIIALFLKNE